MTPVHQRMSGFIVWLATPLFAAAALAFAAPGLDAGSLREFRVELPLELRQLAGHGTASPVMHARVTAAMPANFDPARDWPVMVVSATSDPHYNSSRALLGDYAPTAVSAGWILIAADPEEDVSVEQDDVTLRYALDSAALAALKLQWSGAGRAPLAFGGFSGGAKYSGWLAAAFAGQGRRIVGVYLAGINRDTMVAAAEQFNVLNETFKRTPVFLQSGQKDEIATPADHRGVEDELKRAGFKRIRVEYFPGAHEVDPAPLRKALDWFRELAAPPNTGR